MVIFTGSVQLVIILISVTCAFGHRQKYEGREFYRTHSSLVLVPSDIPTDTEEVHLEHNSIGNLSRGSFSHLTGCVALDLSNNVNNSMQNGAMIGLNNLRRLDLSYNRLRSLNESMWDGLQSLVGLYLYDNFIEAISSGCFRTLTHLETLSLNGNKLTEVRGDMWRGLNSLDALDLGGNPLQTILPGGFGNLPNIGRVSLYKTGLRSLDKNIFNPDDFPDSDGHPRKVKLVLNGNSLQCDEKLCWLKQAEEDGWITWFVAHYVGKPYKGIHSPECGNYPGSLWEDVSLDCPGEGEFILIKIITAVRAFMPELR